MGAPQMPLLMNAAVANTPGSARERPVNSNQDQLTRTIPPTSRNRPLTLGRTCCCASQAF